MTPLCCGPCAAAGLHNTHAEWAVWYPSPGCTWCGPGAGMWLPCSCESSPCESHQGLDTYHIPASLTKACSIIYFPTMPTAVSQERPDRATYAPAPPPCYPPCTALRLTTFFQCGPISPRCSTSLLCVSAPLPLAASRVPAEVYPSLREVRSRRAGALSDVAMVAEAVWPCALWPCCTLRMARCIQWHAASNTVQ